VKKLRVIAAKGRLVPIHSSVASEPGGRLLKIDDQESREVPDCSYVRRRLAAGDLELVGAPISTAAPTTSAPQMKPSPTDGATPKKES
jgi:hypothetical protein